MKLLKNGIFLILLSDFFFGFLPIPVKWANHLGYPALEVIFFRFGFALSGVGILVLSGLGHFKLVNTRAVFWRGFFGGWSVFFFFLTLQFSTAAKATLFNYTYSIWANIFDVLFFRRKPPKGFALSLLIALGGIGWCWGFSGITSSGGIFSGCFPEWRAGRPCWPPRKPAERTMP